MFISKKKLQALENRISELEKAQKQSEKVDLEAMKKAAKESFMQTGKNPFAM